MNKKNDLAMRQHSEVACLGSPCLGLGDCLAINNCTELVPICQGVDFELESRFSPKKQFGLILADSYSRLGLNKKSERVSECGTLLEFAVPVSGGSAKLHSANFCRDRLCPMCSWRRSYKIFGQVSQIMEQIGNDYQFLFLTLTVPSCDGADLPSVLDSMFTAFHARFMRYARIKKVVKGYFRALEITRNNNRSDKSYGLYHPHFHVVLAVPLGYFKSADYVQHDLWLSLWQKAMKDKTITQVDIRRARPKDGAASKGSVPLASVVAEIAKYAVKSSDYLFPDDSTTTDSIVSVLSGALRCRRLTAFAGIFKDVAQQLQLDDPEDGDLVHLDDKLDADLCYIILRYSWGVGCYKLTDIVQSDSLGL